MIEEGTMTGLELLECMSDLENEYDARFFLGVLC